MGGDRLRVDPFDIFIPVSPKDTYKLKFLLGSIIEHVDGWETIHLCMPSNVYWYWTEVHEWVKIVGVGRLRTYDEQEVVPFDKSRLSFRSGWVYQQLLKMFQDVTKNDLYVTVDADVIFNRKTEFFSADGRRIIWRGWEQHYGPYFEFQEKVLGLPREFPGTFINDMNFFDKRIIGEMLERNGFTVQSFLDKCCEVITPECVLAEPEIFGQYVHRHHRDKYEYRQAKTKSWGRQIESLDDNPWPDDEINKTIEIMRGEDIDMFMLHSWFNE